MKLIVSNLKMYQSGLEIRTYLDLLKPYESENIVICPSLIHVPYFLGHKFKVGLQNISFRELENQTGEVSALQGKNLGVTYTIVGHHERRNYFKETNSEVNLKIKLALKNNLKVILCVGESASEKRNNLTEDILKKQLYECLNGITEEVIIAYEPIWLVGTNITPTNEEIEHITKFIKDECLKILNKNVKVLYGGNITPETIEKLNQITNIDGYLIGLSSSKIYDFIEIIKVVNKM